MPPGAHAVAQMLTNPPGMLMSQRVALMAEMARPLPARLLSSGANSQIRHHTIYQQLQKAVSMFGHALPHVPCRSAGWYRTRALTFCCRRHFHTSQLSQTTAWDCLPCVDAAHQQAAASTAKPAMGCTTSTTEPSTSLALANQPWRRHRREVPAPPCLDK